jgi:dienelactone hydrolase
MTKSIITLLILFLTISSFSQNAIEVDQPELTTEIVNLFAELKSNKDSGFYKSIEILEAGLNRTENNFDTYKISLNLGFLYTKTEQFDKCLDMWCAANKKGICFNFMLGDNPYPSYLSAYEDNKRFADFIKRNDSLLVEISKNAKAEYFVTLPVNYDKTQKYPMIVILHGGFGNYYRTFEDWQSDLIKNNFIAVYPQGRVVKSSFIRRYGNQGMDDIAMIYNQVIQKYSVDTSSVILAGQSAGGALSLELADNKLKSAGLLLAFPVKPRSFDIQKAERLKEASVRVVMICGEQDKNFYAGQQELSRLLDSAEVENRFIKYSNLGHEFPDDFNIQIDQGLKYILNHE